jgi:16S rRNA (adenine1518-N6/adenine1519-N6)-dimethyltransferase
MDPHEEIFDVVDEHDQVIGQAPRAAVHAQRLRHRAVHIWLFNNHHELFIQKRAATKDSHPLRYDSSASGHLESGENYDACAIRELREELSIELPAPALSRLFKLDACEDTGWEFVWVYLVQGHHQPVINTQEIEAGRFWPLSVVEDLVDNQPDLCAPAFALVFREMRARELWPKP